MPIQKDTRDSDYHPISTVQLHFLNNFQYQDMYTINYGFLRDAWKVNPSIEMWEFT